MAMAVSDFERRSSEHSGTGTGALRRAMLLRGSLRAGSSGAEAEAGAEAGQSGP